MFTYQNPTLQLSFKYFVNSCTLIFFPEYYKSMQKENLGMDGFEFFGIIFIVNLIEGTWYLSFLKHPGI